MTTLDLRPRKLMQVAYVVQDIEKSVQGFARDFNIGGWVLSEHLEFKQLIYRGEPSSPDLSVAFAYSGEMMFELIQQHDKVPSVFTEVIDTRGYGFHHLAMAVDSLDEAICDENTKGYQVAMDVTVAAGRAAYIDAGASQPGFLELMELSKPLLELLSFVYDMRQDVSKGGPAVYRL